MTQQTTPTTPISQSLDDARHALVGVIDDHDANDPDRLAAAEALAALCEVRPPYPPPDPGHARDPEALLAQALGRLEAAIGEATSIDELTRIATAALIIRRRGQDRP
jgi:hypothetical protein